MSKNSDKENFELKVPLDATDIEDFSPEESVKVAAVDQKGTITSQTVRLSVDGKGSATLNFNEQPGALRVIVGPGDASDEELTGLQTISLNVSSQQWRDGRELQITPIKIHSYYWHWWLYWCRTFTIRGRVVCPDGSPVPAAKVCAYDVDWWFIWTSTQQVGCVTTDINGAFELKFRWCCGWWPWWWWKLRVWQRDRVLSEQVRKVLQINPDVRLSPTASHQPTLAVFNNLFAEEGLDTSRVFRPDDVQTLEQLRNTLLPKLPAAPELERLKLWPWYPWYPWWDCSPDIIFKVTQDCSGQEKVLLEEGIGDTRWNISQALNITLIANEDACCRPLCQDPPCDDGECLVITRVCGNPISSIGGNIGAPANPEGYLHPGALAPLNADRPFGETINVWKNSGDMVAVDYYEIEYDNGSGWQPLPPGAGVTIQRSWLFWNGTDWLHGNVSFPYDDVTFPGHTIYQSREHFEATGPYSDWWPGGTRFWTSGEFLLMRLNSTKFADGTYHFRVVGYEVGTGNSLVNPRVLPLCATQQDNDLVLTFDNRVIDPLLDSPTNPCTPGTSGAVKLCTTEPDTDIIAVRINGQSIDPCEVVDASTGMLEIDFRVHDSSGYLAWYDLRATYKENLSVPLMSLGSLTALTAGTQVGHTYGQARVQGAIAPHWYGGTMRLTVPANLAFPEPCCYQLELRAWKRTVVSCNHNYPYRNRSEYTIGVGVCPPPVLKIPSARDVFTVGESDAEGTLKA